ncbi:hypothetical protein, partial [Mesorhizobium sp. M4B.F.Ca.ET.211.01.1.1]
AIGIAFATITGNDKAIEHHAQCIAGDGIEPQVGFAEGIGLRMIGHLDTQAKGGDTGRQPIAAGIEFDLADSDGIVGYQPGLEQALAHLLAVPVDDQKLDIA